MSQRNSLHKHFVFLILSSLFISCQDRHHESENTMTHISINPIPVPSLNVTPTLDTSKQTIFPSITSEKDRRHLASCIVKAGNWEEIMISHRMESPTLESEYSDSILSQIIIPQLLKESRFSNFAKKTQFYGESMLAFIVENYVLIYPEEIDGWAFLELFTLTEEEEMPYYRCISKLFQKNNLKRYPQSQILDSILTDGNNCSWFLSDDTFWGVVDKQKTRRARYVK